MGLLSSIERFNQRHPWSHNDFYGAWVVEQVIASRARSVLDIGCGTGNLIERLRGRVASVTGMEADAAMAEVAARRFAGDASVVIERARFEPGAVEGQWDAITLVASLHHLPLDASLRALRGCLNPGGRLVVVGCYREASAADLVVGAVAVPVNMFVGWRARPRGTDTPPIEMAAPTASPGETLAEIRDRAAELLPGARIRRRLFWRYSLVYDKP
ncbi:class I SAM-dependent methyltransferase [Nocardia sp. NPDC003482]|uniref:class I SAM-dependent methyltransferase n=1 Tax=Nocardia sp. NPDC004068 TaxID=3364303 RepID=UPI0036AA6100